MFAIRKKLIYTTNHGWLHLNIGTKPDVKSAFVPGYAWRNDDNLKNIAKFKTRKEALEIIEKSKNVSGRKCEYEIYKVG